MTALPVENKFSDKIILTNIDGFKSTFSINDFMPYQSNAGGFIYMNVYKGIQDTWNERQTLNHVPVNIPAREAILNAASNSQTDNQAVIQYFLNPGSNKRIVIFGHTHDAKIISSLNYNGLKSIYANSGTWIDHNNVATTTMNFVVITPQNANVSSQTYVKVYNFEGEVVTKMAADSLRY
jgi:UDP-2,3-diacylglucosamine pyrophosphatase LpxH